MIVKDPGTGVLVGTMVFDYRRTNNALAVVTLDGRSMGSPAGRHRFAYPRGVLDDAGKFHLVWGEPRDHGEDAPDWALLKIASIWHATYDEANGWSEARQILEDPNLFWSPTLGSVRPSRNGGIQVVAPVRPDTLAYLRWSSSVWRHQRLRTPGGLYADVAEGSGQELVISYIGPGEPDSADGTAPVTIGNSVFAIRSGDGGQTWSRPQQVQLSTEGRAVDVRLFGSPTGILTMLWGQNLSGGLYPEALRMVRSEDGGLTWTPPHDVAAAYSVFAAAATADDRIEVVWANTAEPRRLRYACWKGVWSDPTTLFPESSARPQEPALAVTNAGRLHLVWTATRADGDATSEVRILHSTVDPVRSDREAKPGST